SLMSLVWPTDQFLQLCSGYGLHREMFRHNQDRPLVILKSKKTGKHRRRMRIEYRNDAHISSICDSVGRYNTFLSGFSLGLDLAPDQLDLALRRRPEQS